MKIIKKCIMLIILKLLISILIILIIPYFNIINYSLNYLNHIHITMSINNNFIYPLMVSIASILINSYKSTYIHFHILIGNDVEKKNKDKILSLKKLNLNCFLNFIMLEIDLRDGSMVKKD